MSHEAASLAGHLGLGRLVYVYDDNHITIDGPTELSYSDDVPKRFEGYGWHVVQLGEVANDLDALEGGLRDGMAEADAPERSSILRSHIGYPSPKYTDTAHAHGNPLGADEVARGEGDPRARRRRALLRPRRRARVLPRGRDARRRRSRASGSSAAPRCARGEPALAEEYDACLARRGLAGLGGEAADVDGGRAARDPRRRAATVLDAILDVVPGLVGGGADLTGQHRHGARGRRRDRHPRLRRAPGRTSASASTAWASVMNGMAVSGTAAGRRHVLRVQRLHAAARCASPRSRGYKVAFVWSHDSVGVGEDGPDAPAGRAARGAARDARPARHPPRRRQRGRAGVAGAPRRRRPDRDRPHPPEGPGARGHRRARARGRRRGARTCSSTKPGDLDLVLIGTGSEVPLCVGRRATLAARRPRRRVVSMPSWELFEAAGRRVPRRRCCRRVSRRSRSKPASSFGWERYADDVVAIDRFGASAPGDAVHDASSGITPENVVDARGRSCSAGYAPTATEGADA